MKDEKGKKSRIFKGIFFAALFFLLCFNLFESKFPLLVSKIENYFLQKHIEKETLLFSQNLYEKSLDQYTKPAKKPKKKKKKKKKRTAKKENPFDEKKYFAKADPTVFSLFRIGDPPKTKTEPPKPKDKPILYPLPKMVTVRHREGNHIRCNAPFGTNYTTLEVITSPDYRAGKFLPMLDVRAHRFDDNTYAFDVGFVGRFIPYINGSCTIIGLNLYYQFRDQAFGYFQQASFGVEILGRRWDFRANAYVPIGPRTHNCRCVYDDYDGDFIAIQDKLETISYSFDGEVGYYLVRSKNFLLYLGAGPYYISGRENADKTRGGTVRLRPQYKDFIAADISYRYDSVFRSIWEAQISFQLPLYKLGKRRNEKPCGLLPYQIYQPVHFFEVMPVGRKDCWETNY